MIPVPALSRFFLLPVVFLAGCYGTMPSNLGVHDGKLAPCPATPNCVSSQATDDQYWIAPLPFDGAPDVAMTRLKAIVLSLPRTSIVTDNGTYLHIEFTSAIFRFVDDVEFLADDAAKVIQVRSASRIGRSDLGANRKRIESIRERWMVARHT